MAGSISSVDFGDLGSTFNGLVSRQMDIRLLLVKDRVRCNRIDKDTAKALGIATKKAQKPDEEAVKNKLLSKIKELNSKRISFLVENVTIKDQEHEDIGFWRLRIRPDVPIYDEYVFNNQALIVECGRLKGRLRVNKIYLQRVSPSPLPTEELIEGHVLVIDDENEQLNSTFMSKEDFKWLLKLTPRRKELEERLEEWEDYLKLYLSFVRNKQAWIAYKSITRTGPHIARISLSSSIYSNNAVKSFYSDDDVKILDHEIPNDNKWKPNEDTHDPIDFGTLTDAKIIKKNINRDQKKKNQNEWFDVEIELSDKYIYDPEQDTKEKQKTKTDPLNRLPDKGLFVNSLFSDELPISLQQKAIRRLKEGSASNPKLEDFIFDITQARNPLREEEVERENLVETSLNDSQLEALSTSLNSPDISLLQGPPGTGKTTVIAELCYQTVLRGGKVLLASQSNLAVDNALNRLATKKSEIMPIRIGRRTTEEGQDFVEENVVPKWFQSVKENVSKTINDNRTIISNLERSEQAVKDLDYCFKTRLENRKKELATKNDLKEITANIEITQSNDRIVKEKLNVLKKRISILQEVEKKGAYPTQEKFVDFTDVIPDAVSILKHEVENLFSIIGIEIEKQLDAIDLGEFLGYIENISAMKYSDSVETLEKLKDLISKLDHLKNDEIKELELKQSEVVSKITGITDPEDMTTISSELTTINKKIEDLKKTNNELRLGDLWKETVSKLRYQFNYLINISKLIQSKELQDKVESLQRSLQPTKEVESTIDQINKALKIFSDESFEISDKLNLQNEIENHEAELMDSKKESDNLDIQINSLNSSRSNLETELDYIEVKLNQIKTDILKNEILLSKTGFLDGTVKIDENELESIKFELSTQKNKQEEGINKSKRWLKLQSEWVNRIDSASKDEYESLKDTYIDLANVVGATCTETGKYKFWGKEGRNFDLVIIDEVSKATPPELLMPMLLGKQIILVGDHQQLPPLYKINANDDELPISEIDEEDVKRMVKEYEKLVTTSYFKEMFEDAEDFLKARLTVQYRMHPSIMNAINQFYPNGYKLECGIKDPDEKRKHGLTIKGELGADLSSALSHLIWVDTGQKNIGKKIVPNFEDRESGKYKSRYNAFEVETIEKLLLSFSNQLAEQNPGDESKVHDIALISFYAGQVRNLKKMEQRLKDSGLIKNLKLKIGTVDRFQGMESPIVMVSLVSSPKNKGPTSFVKEFRRINVAFSRAQSLLVIVGSENTFSSVKVEIDHDGKKESRKSYGEIINAAKSCSSGNYYVKGYDIHE